MAMTRKDLHEYAETYHQFQIESDVLRARGQSHEAAGFYALDNIHRLERNLHGLFETACNRDLTDTENTRIESIESAVRTMAGILGFQVRFNRDPRGGAIRFVLPSGRSNNWDGETWGIYW